MLAALFHRLHTRLRHGMPSVCAVCHAWPAQALCEDCVQAFAQPAHRCPGCATGMAMPLTVCRTCATQPRNWDRALAAVDYSYPWDRLIKDFKFHENPAWALHFAQLLRNAPWVEPALEAADWLIPVPLSAQRMRLRGFNQSALLARHVCSHKTLEHALLRIRDTPPQSSLPRKERLRNMQHAFAVDPAMHTRLINTRLVLLDDVMTTGASLAAASAALKHAGARHVTVLVLARTPGAAI